MLTCVQRLVIFPKQNRKGIGKNKVREAIVGQFHGKRIYQVKPRATAVTLPLLRYLRTFSVKQESFLHKGATKCRSG